MKHLFAAGTALALLSFPQGSHENVPRFSTNWMVYQDGIVYTGAAKGRFVAVDVRTRRLAWSFEDPKLGTFLKPAFTDEGVFVLADKPSGHTEAIALDRSTGKPLWRRPFVEAARTSSPIVCDGNLILTDYKAGSVVALDGRSGAVRWDTKSEPYHFFNPPAILGPELYFVIKDKGADVGRGIAILNCSDGKPLRIIQVNGIGTSECPIVLYGRKALLTDVVYDGPSHLMLLDLKTERTLWAIRIPAAHAPGSCPAVINERLVTGAGGLWVVDLKTGRTLAERALDESNSQTIIYNDSIILMAGRRSISAWRIDPFTLAWRAPLSGPLASNVVVCGDALCVQTASGRLTLLDAISGKLRGHIPLGSPRPAARSASRS